MNDPDDDKDLGIFEGQNTFQLGGNFFKESFAKMAIFREEGTGGNLH